MTAVVTHLNDIAQFYSDAGETFRASAFVKAAMAISKRPPLEFKGGKLQEKIPGVGPSIQKVIEEFTASGTSAKFNELAAEAQPKKPKTGVTYLQETTDWSDADCRVPNHIYIFDGDKCVGYIKEGTNVISMFKKPSTNFSKRGRKFTKLSNATVKRLVYGV